MVILKTIVGNLSANVNEITFTDNIIDGNSIIEVYYNSNDIYTVETWQREHTIGIVTSDHDFPVSVKVLINNVVAFEPYDDTEVLSQLSDLDNRVYHAEDAISGLTDRVGTAENDIDALETAMTGKQNTLIPGDNITIEDNVISASGGGDIYSTDEIVIGTYIDGKTIYRKTIYIDSDVTLGAQYDIPSSLTGIDTIINMSGTYFDNVDSRMYTLPNLRRTYSEVVYLVSFVPNSHVPVIALQSGGYVYGTISKIRVTLDYTKI